MNLERQSQLKAYHRCLVQAAEAINQAQMYHRDLFGEENGGLLEAAIHVSIQYEFAQESIDD